MDLHPRAKSLKNQDQNLPLVFSIFVDRRTRCPKLQLWTESDGRDEVFIGGH
jgi:hypothetical protein